MTTSTAASHRIPPSDHHHVVLPPSVPPKRSRVGINDIFGGLTSSLVALPSAIAFGMLIYAPLGAEFASMGALAGILGTIAIGFIAPSVGGAERLISAPCAPAAAVMGALVAELLKAGSNVAPQTVPLILTMIAVVAGCMQFLFGAIGGGRLIKYIPYPVVAGYLSGVGLLIVGGQVTKFLGVADGTGLWVAITSPGLWNGPALAVGLSAMVIMFYGNRITNKVPVPILALIGASLVYFFYSLVNPTLASLEGNRFVIGPISGASASELLDVAKARWFGLGGLDWELAQKLVMPSMTLAVLLSIDTLKTCVVLDALTRSRHDSNRVLIGQGLGNLASALAGGMPGAGTMGATLVNLNSGGRTRLSGMLVGVFSLLIFLVLGKLVAWVPLAALAGILMVVGYRMIDRHSLHLLKQSTTRYDFGVIAAVVITAVTVNLMAAALVGLLLAITLFLRDQIRGSVVRRKSLGHEYFSKKRRLPAEMSCLEQGGKATAIFQLQGSLFFGTTDQLFNEVEPYLGHCRYVVFDMKRISSIDFTATHLMEQIESRIADNGGSLVLANLPASLPGVADLRRYLSDLGLIHHKRRIMVFPDLDEAMEWTEDQILADANLVIEHTRPPLMLEEIDIMRRVRPEALKMLSTCLEERVYQAGAKIFSAGDRGDELYLLRKGEVKITLPLLHDKGHHIASFGRGDFFGDMAFLDRHPRSADAMASRECHLYALSRKRFDQAVEIHPELGAEIFQHLALVLALRLRRTDAELRALEMS